MDNTNKDGAHICTPADERALFDKAFLSWNGFHTQAELDAEWNSRGGLAATMFREGFRAAQGAGTAPVYWNSQLKMVERAIIGLRDGWASRKDADDALAILATPPTPVSTAAAPDGWQMVPKEPEVAQGMFGHMILAVRQAMTDPRYNSVADIEAAKQWNGNTTNLVRAIIAAATRHSEKWTTATVSTAAATTASVSDEPCATCDGSGSVHRADGEYMGECPCGGNSPAPSRAADGQQGANFCARCGKRLGNGVHTCTPPADGQQGASRAALNYKPTAEYSAWFEKARHKLRNHSIFTKGAVIWNAALARAPLPAQDDAK